MAGAGGDKSFTEASSSSLSPVLRISQLDAFELDAALEQLVWSQFSQCFQHFKPGLLTPFEPELRALLRLLLWRFTVYSHSATVGQSLLNLRYKNDQTQGLRYRPMNRSQRLWYVLFTAGEKWLRERSHSLFLNHPAESNIHKARKALAYVGGLAKVASLLNFLLFLQRGTYPLLTERLLGIQAVFNKPQGLRDINFHYVNRELLWHGFAEFLIFLLPLVNVQKLKASMCAVFSPLQKGEENSAEMSRTECGLCGEWPIMPHSIGCSHVFCYYCIKSHTIADMYFSCPKCGKEVSSVEPVKLQIEMNELQQAE
ncbi:peroxisome biogenesis factor 2 [Chanos chanos]|uniref:Peroxisome biogenesis factor 2 n=1 Tax=Chanos chanos TaxID=29144 RepID=A0A6J2V0N2_CHACN|nr:peroxisome biogenesis factor 2 [Chanos chanos]